MEEIQIVVIPQEKLDVDSYVVVSGLLCVGVIGGVTCIAIG